MSDCHYARNVNQFVILFAVDVIRVVAWKGKVHNIAVRVHG